MGVRGKRGGSGTWHNDRGNPKGPQQNAPKPIAMSFRVFKNPLVENSISSDGWRKKAFLFKSLVVFLLIRSHLSDIGEAFLPTHRNKNKITAGQSASQLVTAHNFEPKKSEFWMILRMDFFRYDNATQQLSNQTPSWTGMYK